MQPDVHAWFHKGTNTVSYLVWDPATGHAAVIDPVLDYDQAGARTSTASAEAVLAEVAARGLELKWILETHAHADHLSAADWLRERTGAPVGAGRGILEVQATFAALLQVEDLKPGGRDFDRLWADGEEFALGELSVRVLHTPGHTPACVSYLMGDAVFVGDTLFMPDFGTARTDFPGGCARTLYRSIRRLLDLPPETRVFVGHDYLPKARPGAEARTAFAWETTVAAQRTSNLHVGGDIGEDGFVAMREARDATLPVPALLLPALQVNIRAGRLPPPDADGRRWLKLPLDAV